MNYNNMPTILNNGQNNFSDSRSSYGSIIFDKKEDSRKIKGYDNQILEQIGIKTKSSSYDIIKKCDEWLEIFKSTHDVFKELVLSGKYKNQNIYMLLTCSENISKQGKSWTINLDLERRGDLIQKGVSIKVKEENKDILKYLINSVISYYLSKNYNNESVDLSNFNWFLASDTNFVQNPILANIGVLAHDNELSELALYIITKHNTQTLNQNISDYFKTKIQNQYVSNEFYEEIEASQKQYKLIERNK